MAKVKIVIPGFGDNDSESTIVILGPNGSGKTQLAQKITISNKVSAIGAQRRTWVDDSLPVQEEQNLRNQVQNQQDQWKQNSWRTTEEINFVLSTLIQDHTNQLTQRNEEAIASGTALDPVNNTNLIRLQALWNRLFPKRKLEIGGFFPKVKCLDVPSPAPTYQLRNMSDGERTVLYMAARVMIAEQPVILVDEPELHMHSRLAIQFWDEAEKLRPDCRFVYITHDLNFALSRRKAIYLITRSKDNAEHLFVEGLPSTIATEVLGAATLPFYAKRIFFFEGEPGKGFANEFFFAWFDDNSTFVIPAGDRNSVCAAVSGLKATGVVSAEILGMIDRDYYSDDVLNAITNGVSVLPLHEIESIICDKTVVSLLSEYLGKDPSTICDKFLSQVQTKYSGKTFNALVARRVRCRIGDLFNGAFKSKQINADFSLTAKNHAQSFIDLNLQSKILTMFEEDSKLVKSSLENYDNKMLAILPGKHLHNILSKILGLSRTEELTNLVIQSLNRKQLKPTDPLFSLGENIEKALLSYLPARSV